VEVSNKQKAKRESTVDDDGIRVIGIDFQRHRGPTIRLSELANFLCHKTQTEIACSVEGLRERRVRRRGMADIR
jgi:hypothetical protein